MHGEAPEFRRCCFCLPLRRGLIAWGYTKLVLILLTIAYLIAMTLWVTRRTYSRFKSSDVAILTIIFISLVIDVSFDVIFIVGSHMKSVKLLNIAYIYNMVWMGLVLVGNCFQLYLNLYYVFRIWDYFEYRMYIIMDVCFSAGLAFSLLFVQVYLILLIRSEVAKLRKQSLEMQFSNHLASGEPQCTLHNASVADQYQGKQQVVQLGTGETQVVQHCCAGTKQVCCTDEGCNNAKTPV